MKPDTSRPGFYWWFAKDYSSKGIRYLMLHEKSFDGETRWRLHETGWQLVRDSVPQKDAARMVGEQTNFIDISTVNLGRIRSEKHTC